MDKPRSLNSLFKEKIFRIPDYQRGYAWQIDQLRAFWEDLINLSDDRSHYTGVLTLKEIDNDEIKNSDNEYWLIDDHSYTMYHVVDGQQRLTTFIIFLQAFINFIRQMDENVNKPDEEVFITDSLDLKTVVDSYLFKTKPSEMYRTYKFGYTVDNPSYEYLRHKIFEEEGGGTVDETFYTLNLSNAKDYFSGQLKELHAKNGLNGLQKVYKKLTKNFLFNEYIIKDEFDVFVAFETMNNRGKKLSDLELLKNRLIYLTTLYPDTELNDADRQELREDINNAWKEVYHQLGRNKKRPLNDDDFLKAHWIMYFRYSRKRGNDYIKFLLDEQFSPKRIYTKKEREVDIELPEEQRSDFENDDDENEIDDLEETTSETTALLEPNEIKDYVNSLKEIAVHWFNSYYPYLADGLAPEEQDALDKLNRIVMGHFRPLVVSFFKNNNNTKDRIELLRHIERFIFIIFRLCQTRRNYRDSEFYNASREYGEGFLDLEGIKQKLHRAAAFSFLDDDNRILDARYFREYLHRKFRSGDKNGFYGWNGLHYFLYEYELSLLSESRHKKVFWEDFLKTQKDKVSIEHIFPQTPTDSWQSHFSSIAKENYHFYSGSIGNLLLLSMSINSSLQNDDFEDKKDPKEDENGEKIRNGYSDGSHSEIEVSKFNNWTPATIEERGIKLLNFMKNRWDIEFENDETKKALLFLNKETDEE